MHIVINFMTVMVIVPTVFSSLSLRSPPFLFLPLFCSPFDHDIKWLYAFG